MSALLFLFLSIKCTDVYFSNPQDDNFTITYNNNF